MATPQDNPAGILPLPYPSASGTYRVPINALVDGGFAKKVAPGIWEIIQDVELTVFESEALVMVMGSRWASIDPPASPKTSSPNTEFQNLRLQLFN